MNFKEKKNYTLLSFFPQTETAPAVRGSFRTFGQTDVRVFGPWEKDGGPPENHTGTERTCSRHTE